MDTKDKQEIPECPSCGRDDSMFYFNGEWVCHNTHRKDDPDFLAIAVQDLVTVVCERFAESLEKFGYTYGGMDKTVAEWFMGKSEEERKLVADMIVGGLVKGVKEPE